MCLIEGLKIHKVACYMDRLSAHREPVLELGESIAPFSIECAISSSHPGNVLFLILFVLVFLVNFRSE